MNTSSTCCAAHGHQRLPMLWSALSEDIHCFLTRSPENQAAGEDFMHRLSAFFTPELLCLFLYRTSHYLWVNKWRRLAVGVSRFNFLVHKASITPQSCIGPGFRLSHPPGVTFHGKAGRNLTLFHLAVCCSRGDRLEGSADNGPQLCARVTVGGHALRLGQVIVGDGTTLAFSVR